MICVDQLIVLRSILFNKLNQTQILNTFAMYFQAGEK